MGSWVTEKLKEDKQTFLWFYDDGAASDLSAPLGLNIHLTFLIFCVFMFKAVLGGNGGNPLFKKYLSAGGRSPSVRQTYLRSIAGSSYVED